MTKQRKKKAIGEIIMEELNLESLEINKRREIIDEIISVVMKNSVVEALVELSPEGINDLNSMLRHKPKPNELFLFMRTKGIDIDTIIINEIKLFRQNSDKIMREVVK